MVESATFINDILKFIKLDLEENIEDPLPKRGSTSKFVMTSYPQRAVQYPLITIKLTNQEAARAGMQTTAMDVRIEIEIRIWARNEKEKDTITNQVYKRLRDVQFTATTGSVANNLHNFNLLSGVEVTEEKIKSRILQVTYTFWDI